MKPCGIGHLCYFVFVPVRLIVELIFQNSQLASAFSPPFAGSILLIIVILILLERFRLRWFLIGDDLVNVFVAFLFKNLISLKVVLVEDLLFGGQQLSKEVFGGRQR